MMGSRLRRRARLIALAGFGTGCPAAEKALLICFALLTAAFLGLIVGAIEGLV